MGKRSIHNNGIRSKLGAVLIVVSCWAACPAVGFAQNLGRMGIADLKVLQSSFEQLAKKVRPSVVAIQTYVVHDPKQEDARLVRMPISQGSGFIADDSGFIVTNRHVLEDANFFVVTLHNGLQYVAEVVGADPRSDLAVLKIEAEGLVAVSWGNGNDLKVGHWTFAVGNPFGLANGGKMSVTVGTVSALGRDMTFRLADDTDIEYYGNLIETSATINPGSSGGALFNIDGKVIGIVTAIETSTGVSEGAGFAIPINADTLHIVETLKAGRPVRYGFLGVVVTPGVVRASDRKVVRTSAFDGARIDHLSIANGPAAQAGLRPEDIIVAVDGIPVLDSDHLVRLVGFKPVGSKISVTYLRKNVKRKTTVVLGDRTELLRQSRN